MDEENNSRKRRRRSNVTSNSNTNKSRKDKALEADEGSEVWEAVEDQDVETPADQDKDELDSFKSDKTLKVSIQAKDLPKRRLSDLSPMEKTARKLETAQRTSERATRLALHQVHLLCLLAVGMRRSRLCSHPEIQTALKSNLPQDLTENDVRDVPLVLLQDIVAWWRQNFSLVSTPRETQRNSETNLDLVSLEQLKLALMEHEGTLDESIQLFVGICRSLRMRARLVMSLQPLSAKLASDNLVRSASLPSPSSTNEPPPRNLTKSTTSPLPKPSPSDFNVIRQPFSSDSFLVGDNPASINVLFGRSSDPPIIWAEVYSPNENRWIAIDVVRGMVDQPEALDVEHVKTPLVYAVAFETQRSTRKTVVKDVTMRYAAKWGSRTKKLRVADESWWHETMISLEGTAEDSDDEDRWRWETAELSSKVESEQMPTTFDQFRNHPKFALERHLKKYECMFPRHPILGHVRGEAVFPRANVKQLRSREAWMKVARVVKANEEPIKLIKTKTSSSRRRISRQNSTQDIDQGEDEQDDEVEDYNSQSQGVDDAGPTSQPLSALYGEWQTERFVPPQAKDGIVPKNQFNNVDLYQTSMLPLGTVHMKEPGLWRLAKKLGIDYADAVVGFEFKRGYAFPVKEGIVVCAEFRAVLLAAFDEEQHRLAEERRAQREKQACLNWRNLVRKLLLSKRLDDKYQQQSPLPASQSKSDQKPTKNVEHEHQWTARYDDLSESTMYICACGITTTTITKTYDLQSSSHSPVKHRPSSSESSSASDEEKEITISSQPLPSSTTKKDVKATTGPRSLSQVVATPKRRRLVKKTDESNAQSHSSSSSSSSEDDH